MTTEIRPAHSPLGASGAERWMNCPGSVALLKQLYIPEETDEPDYRSEGTTAHEAAAHCLKTGEETFELIGRQFEKHKVSQEMADAIGMYVRECLSLIASGDTVLIEQGIAAPDFHPDFYGTVDFSVFKATTKTLYIRDFKYGIGIAVDAEDNPQLMYYAYGLLRRNPEAEEIDMGIVQPRAFHPDGPIRAWRITAKDLCAWAEETLLPSMIATAMESDLDAGSWCRFCLAKLVCPLQEALFGAATTADPKKLIELTDGSLGRSYQYIAAVKQYIKALEEEVFRRLMGGAPIEGTKLVNKKANRVWKPEAENILMVTFGDRAYEPASLKSPAEIAKMGEDAKALVTQYAYTPQSDLTVALASDRRAAVPPPKPEAFTDFISGDNTDSKQV